MSSTYAHGAAVSIVHGGQKMEISDSWPYLATPRVVPALAATNPTNPAPARAVPESGNTSHTEDAVMTASVPQLPSFAAARASSIANTKSSSNGGSRGGNDLFSNSDLSKLLLFAAAACAAVVIFDLSAKNFSKK